MSRRDYEPRDRKMRARQLRFDGRDCAVAGYTGFADACYEMADLLDPPPPPEPELRPRRPQWIRNGMSTHGQQTRTPTHGVNGSNNNAASRITNTPRVNHSSVRNTPGKRNQSYGGSTMASSPPNNGRAPRSPSQAR